MNEIGQMEDLSVERNIILKLIFKLPYERGILD
jgi:hypothetical protein